MFDLSNLRDLNSMHAIDLAIYWADRGLPVVATHPDTKAPWVGKEWEKKATTSQVEIHDMWRRQPTARVGIKTGLACGCGCMDGPDVLDFDVSEGKPGLEQLITLIDRGVIDPSKTLNVETPSGGRHLWSAGSTQHNKQNIDEAWGVDLRAHHGMVLAPGNPGYKLIGGAPEALGPSPIWEAVTGCPGIRQKPQKTRLAAPGTNRPLPPRMDAPPGPARPTAGLPDGKPRTRLVAPLRGFDDPVGEESPLDWYSRNYDVESVLLAAGWTFAYDTVDGRRFFTRPGKHVRDGVSGNIAVMPDGRNVFYNFSSSTDLPTDRALSPAQLYAWFDHGGDMRAAAKQIRQSMMPQRERMATATPAPAPAPPSVVLGGPPANEEPPAGTYTPPALAPALPGALVPINDTFWTERPELRDIRWLARERRVSPWSMLGSVLALASCRLGPHVVLPKIVGGNASLNLLVGLVGPSGKGKGASWETAQDYLAVEGKFMVEEIATPQGIDSAFTETPAKGGPVQFNDVAFFYVPEIDSMKAQTEASGGALLPHLRKVYSGELLGGRTANRERRRPVRAHSYRASVVVGIQPARSGVLLNDADGGLPQRFVWLPVHDPDLLRRSDKLQPPLYSGEPPRLDFDVWIPQGEQRGDKDEPLPVETPYRHEVPVCQTAQDEIIDAREENLASEHGGMNSHALLTQLKVATLLAFINRRLEVREDDWRLARLVMKVSDKTRASCERALADAEKEEHARRGRNRAVQDVHAEISRTVVRDERVDRIHELGTKLLEHMQAKPGAEFSPRELRILMGDAKTGKEYWEDVQTALVGTPGVIQGPEISAGGRRIRKMSWQPNNTA